MKIVRNSGRPKKLVAIVTPVARFPVTADEEVSLRHLRKYLGAFDRYIIGQRALPREFSDFALKRFPPRYFTDRLAYNRLMLLQHPQRSADTPQR